MKGEEGNVKEEFLKLNDEQVNKDWLKPPDDVIPPIPLLPLIPGIACPFPECLWATNVGSTYKNRHKHNAWSPPRWPWCTMQQPYSNGDHGSLYWQVQPVEDIAPKVQHTPVTTVMKHVLRNIRVRELHGGEEVTVLRVPENKRVLHPGYTALQWDLMVGGPDGTERRDLPALCGLVARPAELDPLNVIMVQSAKYFEEAQPLMSRQLHVSVRQWLNSESEGQYVARLFTYLP